MTIVSLTMIYNEADILELFVRHHLQFVDHMVLILHGRSVDATEEIALGLQREGLPLTLEHVDVPAFEQSAILTAASARAVAVHRPDLLLPLDCDEFLCGENRHSVRAALESLPADRVTAVPWRTYVPKTEHADIVHRMTHRRRAETPPQYCKVIIPRAFLRQSPVILQGSHGIAVDGKEVSSESSHSLWLAHLPIRSSEQARQKALHAWPRQRDNPHGKTGDCYQWQTLYQSAMDGGVFDHERIIELAALYACAYTDRAPALVEDPLVAYVSV